MKKVILALSLLTAAPALADPVPAWTHQLPTAICQPAAPSTGCLTTQALDLRRAKYYRLSVQAMNFAPGVTPAPSKVRLRDAGNIADGCFGACTVLTVPFSTPPQGSCCMGTYTSSIIPIPASQRRAAARLRIEVIGGFYSYAGSGLPPVIQFYTD